MTIYFATNSGMPFDHLEGPVVNNTSSGFDSAFTDASFYCNGAVFEIPLPSALPDVWLHMSVDMSLHQQTGNTFVGINTGLNREEIYWRRVQNDGDMSLHMWNGTGYTTLVTLPASSEPAGTRNIDIHWKIHPTEGVFEIYMDDGVIMRAENLDTSGLSIDTIRLVSTQNSPIYYSQVLVADEPTICWRLSNRVILNNTERLGFVGQSMQAIAGATSGNNDLSLTGLTGGYRSAPIADDYVVAMFAVGSTANRTLSITDPDGVAYTLLGSELYFSDNFDVNLRVAYKKMGSTPDTFVRFGPTGAVADAGVIAVAVINGADLTTFLDNTPVSGAIGNTSQFDPSTLTVATALARNMIIGASAHDGTLNNFNNTQNLPIWYQLGSTGTNSIRLVFGISEEVTSGSINYGQITTNVVVNTSSVGYLAFTMRPARVPQTFSDAANDVSNIYSSGGRAFFNIAGASAADQIIRGRSLTKALPSQAYKIKGVALTSRVRKGETGPQNFNPLVRTYLTDYHKADQSVSEAIDPVNAIWELNPNTGLPWTLEEATAALVGIRART